MKINIAQKDITVEVRPQFLLLHCFVQDTPFKKKYIGYSKTEARKAFITYVKEEASKVFVNEPL